MLGRPAGGLGEAAGGFFESPGTLKTVLQSAACSQLTCTPTLTRVTPSPR